MPLDLKKNLNTVAGSGGINDLRTQDEYRTYGHTDMVES
jgi:hypothetical protein